MDQMYNAYQGDLPRDFNRNKKKLSPYRQNVTAGDFYMPKMQGNNM